MKKPLVFLSHTSSDDGFVRKLDARLTARGLEVINDERSFALGDSLVEDIFDKGLSRADGCVLILSSDSIERPWPRAELHAAVVESVERGMKLIPILLDDIGVPPSLKGRIFYKVGDRDSDEEIERIAIRVELSVRSIGADVEEQGLPKHVRESEVVKRELLVRFQGHFENLRPLFFHRGVDVERWKSAHQELYDRAMKTDVNAALGADYPAFMKAVRGEGRNIEIEAQNQAKYTKLIVDKDGKELSGAGHAKRQYGAFFQQLLADTILGYVPWVRIFGDPAMDDDYERSAEQWRELALRQLAG
jgi:hypothetical protein